MKNEEWRPSHPQPLSPSKARGETSEMENEEWGQVFAVVVVRVSCLWLFLYFEGEILCFGNVFLRAENIVLHVKNGGVKVVPYICKRILKRINNRSFASSNLELTSWSKKE